MIFSNTIRLFWWNEIKLQNKSKENYGDLLSKYLVEKISNKKVVWAKPSLFSIYNYFKPIYVTAGSILAHVNNNCIVWGSGIISKNYPVKKAKFLAVRGPQTRKYLLKLGYTVPEIYGDPGLLLPKFYSPEIKVEYKYGIIPHYNDYDLVKDTYVGNKDILVIDLMTNDIEYTTDQILRCERLISSSLHGIIIAHAYGIGAIWQRFSDIPFGDNIKFQDYFESVKIKPYLPPIQLPDNSISELDKIFEQLPFLPKEEDMENLRIGLLKVCPFKYTA